MARTVNRVILLLAFVLSGCRPADMPNVAEVDPLGWGRGDTARIEFINTDTSGVRDLNIILRTDRRFTLSELPLSVRVETPDSLYYEETLTLRCGQRAHRDNEYCDTTHPYRRNTRLGATGTYIFKVTPRADDLRGIWGIGVTAHPNSTNNHGQE